MTAPRRIMMAAAGNVPAPYPTISNEHSRWRADQGVTTSGGSVSAWNDISLVGDGDNNWAQGTGANQPTHSTTGGPAGDGSITFDGSNDDLLVASGMASFAQPLHFFLLVKQLSYTASDFLLNGTNAADYAIRCNGPTDSVAQDATGGSYSNHVVMTSGTWFLLDSFFSGASSYQRLNNGTKESGENPGTGAAQTRMRLCAEGDGGNEGNFEIAELVFFTAEVTGADLTALMAYFSDRYGLF